MYSLVFDSRVINQQLYTAIEELIKIYSFQKTCKILNLTKTQLTWLFQFSDTKDFSNLQELFNLFHKKKIEISELKLKRAVLLILAYQKKIITF